MLDLEKKIINLSFAHNELLYAILNEYPDPSDFPLKFVLYLKQTHQLNN